MLPGREGEDLTVISTGTITYVEPLQFQEEARLSTVSWGDYTEGSIFRSEHESVIYTHDDANFIDILDWGSTTGNIIANNAVSDHPWDPKKDGISLLELLTYEKFYYSDRAEHDPPSGTQITPWHNKRHTEANGLAGGAIIKDMNRSVVIVGLIVLFTLGLVLFSLYQTKNLERKTGVLKEKGQVKEAVIKQPGQFVPSQPEDFGMVVINESNQPQTQEEWDRLISEKVRELKSGSTPRNLAED